MNRRDLEERAYKILGVVAAALVLRDLVFIVVAW